VVCTESAENWHVKGLSFNFSVDEDGCSSEGSTDASTSSPRFLMNGDKVKQKPPLQSDGFTSEESTDTLTDRPRFFMDSGLMKQILADGLDGAESTDTSTCSPDLMMDVDMAQQMRFIQLAESVCQVRDLVGYACGFLRMDRSRILVDTNEKCRRRGSVALIRMYVHHLPFAKRARWRSPLLLSICAVLQRNGCVAKVQGNELFAQLGGGALARIDFVASCDDKTTDTQSTHQI